MANQVYFTHGYDHSRQHEVLRDDRSCLWKNFRAQWSCSWLSIGLKNRQMYFTLYWSFWETEKTPIRIAEGQNEKDFWKFEDIYKMQTQKHSNLVNFCFAHGRSVSSFCPRVRQCTRLHLPPSRFARRSVYCGCWFTYFRLDLAYKFWKFI